MPRKSSKRKNRRSRSSGPRTSLSGVDRTVVITGKLLLPLTTTTGVNTLTIPIDPLNMDSSRLGPLAAGFELFRFTSINIRVYPVLSVQAAPNGRTSLTISFDKLDNSPPGSLPEAYIAPVSRYIDEFVTVPVSMKIKRQDLMHNITPWFSCRSTGAPGANQTIQGYLHFVGGEQFDTAAEVSYSIQFRTPSSGQDDVLKVPSLSRLSIKSSNPAPQKATPKEPEKVDSEFTVLCSCKH